MSAGYTNLRTVSYRDTIAELIARANQTHTRATGVQVFSSGDGMAYEDTEGFINPISPALFDDAKSQIAEASEALVAAEADLEAAQGRIDETTVLLGQLDEQAAASAEQVAGVVKDMEADRTRLTAAQADLDALKPRVGSVENAVSQANAAAGKAMQDAAAASSTASAAMEEYDGLRVRLDAALAAKPGLIKDSGFTLDTAWVTYRGATIVASSEAGSAPKALSIPPTTADSFAYSTQDVPVVQGNVYRLTVYILVKGPLAGSANFLLRGGGDTGTLLSNTPYIDLASGGRVSGEWQTIQETWVAPETRTVRFGFQVRYTTSQMLVDDFQVVDTTAEADLTLAVEDARQRAEEAARSAAEAMKAAGQAQLSANGKTTITSTLNPPSGVGLAVGDIHMMLSGMGSGATIQRQWRWNGSVWVENKVDGQFIANLDVGKLTGTFANISQHLQAGSIGADKVLIGVGGNLAPDPRFQSPAAWGGSSFVQPNAPGKYARGAFVIPPGTTTRGAYMSQMVPAPRSGRVRVSVWAKPDAEVRGAGLYLYARGYFQDGTWAFPTPSNRTLSSTAPANTWVKIEGEFVLPEGAASLSIGLYASAGYTGQVTFSDLHAQAFEDGALIVNGTITGNKVDAQSVAGAVGQFVKVQAENVEVTDTLAARVLSAATSQVATSFVTDRLVVGTGDNRTVLEVLGTAVANDLNLRGTLRGRDAILDGTLDVEQLNVTKEMVAEMGRFMSVDTKKLIVTEAAVMQHVTAIEGIITPKITASEAKMVNLIAEKASIADIQAGNITMTGHFRSGAVGMPGVIIPKNYTIQPGVEQLGVWLAPDGKAPSLGAVWGRTAGMWLDNASNVAGSTNSSPLFIRGQAGAGVCVMGGLSVGNSAGNALITPVGGGNVVISARSGDADLSAGRYANLIGGSTANVITPGDLYLKGGSSIRFVYPNDSPYSKSWTGGGLKTVYMGGSSGIVYTETSTSRAKVDIETAEPDHEWLDMRTVTYRDRIAVELKAEIEARRAAGDCTPLTAEEHERLAISDRRIPGRIAEEGVGVADAQVVLDGSGQVEGWDYSRDAVMLTPHVREHRDKIADLESRIAELESALL